MSDIPDKATGGPAKTLQPGNAVIKINEIRLKTEPFPGDPVNIILVCEGEDLGEGFQGFAYDKDKPELGNAKGQVGNVRGTPYSFDDGGKAKTPKNKERDLLIWLKQFCKATGLDAWIDAQNDVHDTAADFFEQLNKDKLFKNQWYMACLCAKAYVNKENFLNYDLFFPYFNGGNVPIEVLGTQPSKLIQYDEKNPKMLIQPKTKKAEEVESFTSKKSSKGANLDL